MGLNSWETPYKKKIHPVFKQGHTDRFRTGNVTQAAHIAAFALPSALLFRSLCDEKAQFSPCWSWRFSTKIQSSNMNTRAWKCPAGFCRTLWQQVSLVLAAGAVVPPVSLTCYRFWIQSPKASGLGLCLDLCLWGTRVSSGSCQSLQELSNIHPNLCWFFFSQELEFEHDHFLFINCEKTSYWSFS